MAARANEPVLTSERNDAVLALALGGLLAAERLERALRPARLDDGVLEPDDPVVLASVGAIALGRALRRWLTHAVTPGPAPAAPADDAAAPSARRLLR